MQVILFNFVFYSCIISTVLSGIGIARATSPQERKFHFYLMATVFILGVIALLVIYYLPPYTNS